MSSRGGVDIAVVGAAAVGCAVVWMFRTRGEKAGASRPEIGSGSPTNGGGIKDADESDDIVTVQEPKASNGGVLPLKFPIAFKQLKEEERCFNCFELDHPSAKCQKTLSRCMNCGRYGHKSYKCPSKSKPRA